MATLATSIPNTMPLAVGAAGKFVAETIEAGMPTKRLRGVGTSGARVGAYVKPPQKLGNAAAALVAARGPFQLIEHSIASHSIEPRSVGAAVNNVLTVPGSESGYAASVEHPGVSRGAGPFQRGVLAARPAVPRIMHEAMLIQMRTVI